MTDLVELVPHGILLSSFGADAVTLKPDAFAAANGPAFFVLVTGAPEEPPTLQRTTDIGTLHERGGEQGIYVQPLLRKEGNRKAVLRVGRGSGCDVVINDTSISKLHAYVEPAGSGFSLVDAGSQNGTFVDDLRVPVRGIGAPVTLLPLARVRFGSVPFVFLPAAELAELARGERHL